MRFLKDEGELQLVEEGSRLF